MTNYLIYSGLLFNALIALAAITVVFVWFIWPAVEAASITRCQRKVSKTYGGKPSAKDIWKTFKYWYSDLLFGRSWERISNRQFEWEGVGNWTVYSGQD